MLSSAVWTTYCIFFFCMFLSSPGVHHTATHLHAATEVCENCFKVWICLIAWFPVSQSSMANFLSRTSTRWKAAETMVETLYKQKIHQLMKELRTSLRKCRHCGKLFSTTHRVRLGCTRAKTSSLVASVLSRRGIRCKVVTFVWSFVTVRIQLSNWKRAFAGAAFTWDCWHHCKTI